MSVRLESVVKGLGVVAAVYLAAALVLGAWMAFGCGSAPEQIVEEKAEESGPGSR